MCNEDNSASVREYTITFLYLGSQRTKYVWLRHSLLSEDNSYNYNRQTKKYITIDLDHDYKALEVRLSLLFSASRNSDTFDPRSEVAYTDSRVHADTSNESFRRHLLYPYSEYMLYYLSDYN